MTAIIRGTTPLIRYRFNSTNVADIATAFLVVKQSGRNMVEHDLTEATKDSTDNTIAWRLSQADTLSLTDKEVTIVCDWVVQSGVRGRTNILKLPVEESGKSKVI